jgi:ActR/RegA family two-component response regulator
MSEAAEATDTILIVDDEESVRQTFREWLDQEADGCRILVAADAEAALTLANRETVDLAILDWNLGAGNDGLQLLEDLYLFNPDVVAIMVTGFAYQATPLDAMRMGVRDYLDKNQDLDRESFLRAVHRQLERIRPAKRERHLHQSLVAFREAVQMVLPLVRSAAAPGRETASFWYAITMPIESRLRSAGRSRLTGRKWPERWPRSRVRWPERSPACRNRTRPSDWRVQRLRDRWNCSRLNAAGHRSWPRRSPLPLARKSFLNFSTNRVPPEPGSPKRTAR